MRNCKNRELNTIGTSLKGRNEFCAQSKTQEITDKWIEYLSSGITGKRS